MKKLLSFILVLFAVFVTAQTTPTGTTSAGKFKMFIPTTGAVNDSVVVWNGTDKLMKFVPRSSFVSPVPSLQAVTDVENETTNPIFTGNITVTDVGGGDAVFYGKYNSDDGLGRILLEDTKTGYVTDIRVLEPTAYNTITFKDESGTVAYLSDITGGGYTVVSSNTTASNDTNYTVVANATFTDPSPTDGKGYVVYVRNGTATIGGTGYAVGSLVFRVFHSGGWNSVNFGLKENEITAGTTGQYFRGDKTFQTLDKTAVGLSNVDNTSDANKPVSTAQQAQLDLKDVLPVIYEKHANVPTFGGTALNNLEGFAFTITGATARNFSDTNAYTRRQRLGLTVAATGNLGQARQTATYFNRNSNLDIIIGLGFSENCTNSSVRVFAGVSTTTLFANVEPTALLNCIGLAKLTTSNNLHLIHNDGSGTATAIDLGSSFPSNTIDTDFYVLRLKTNGSNIDYVVTRVNTGDAATGSLTSDLPSASTAMNLGYYVVQSSGANTTTGIDCFGTNIIKL